MGSEFFDGHEFLIDAKPVREQQAHEHQCVCLLLHGTPADIAATGGRRDKCQQMVSSPDQAFCDDCENEEHHLAGNQYGEARNIHRKGKGMNTLSWLEIMLAVILTVGTFMYYFGFAMGREQDKKDQEGRRASMRNHPSYALRVKQWEEEKD